MTILDAVELKRVRLIRNPCGKVRFQRSLLKAPSQVEGLQMVEDAYSGALGGQKEPGDTDLRELIKDAFARARAAGRPNEMTVAVLKNRLLDLTDHDFSESNYGYSSMSGLARNLSDLLELDETVRPARVRLREDTPSPQNEFTGMQVRGDLWNAILDYSRGEPYIWNGTSAIPASETEGSTSGPVMPTITREEEAAWRADFQERASAPLSQGARDGLQYWIDKHQTPRILPVFLQRQWNTDLKNHVIDRLRTWFAEQGIPEPTDLFVPYHRPVANAPDRLAELRALVIRCVQNMTEAELSEMRLPPQALLRGQK